MALTLPRPEPAAGLLAYEEELDARLRFDRRCAENWERYRTAGHRAAVVDYLPVKLDVENVSRCNFACTMCAVSTWKKRQRAADMSLAAFKALIDEQYGLVEIKLNGIGEPLMQGDDWFAMIRYARERRIWVRVTTNASLLHLRGNYRKLIDSGVNEIDISVDGADRETFEKIRIGSDFDRVVRNCGLLNEYAASRGRPSAKMWTLVQRANCDFLPQHVWLAAEMGFRHLVFSLQLHGWGDAALEARNVGEAVGLPKSEAALLIALGARKGVRVAFWDVAEKFEAVDGKRCPWPFSRAVVTSDLRTVPCCMIGNPDAFEIGRGRTFAENWAGEEFAAFRQAHLDGDVPAVCRACYRAPPAGVEPTLGRPPTPGPAGGAPTSME